MQSLYKHIKKDSPQNAAKVSAAIIDAVEKAATNPGLYNPDKYRKNNDDSYRAFEIKSYRVTYRFAQNIIRILRVRHTSRRPKLY